MTTGIQNTRIILPDLPKEKGHFVYIDRKPDGSPFYVGIGKKRRVFIKVRNKLHTRICNKYPGCYREIVLNGTRIEALTEEKRLVRLYGRIDTQTGILSNLTDGGDGGTGSIRTDAQRSYSSVKMKTKYSTPEWKEHWKNSTLRLFTDESVRAKHHMGVTAAWSRDEVREIHRVNTTSAMARPEVKEKQIRGLRAACSTPEAKAKRSIITKRVFSDPEVKRRQVEKLKRTMSTPEFRRGLSERLFECQSRPDVKAKKSEGTRLMHAAKKAFVELTGYTGRYSKITGEMLDTLDQAQALALDSKAVTQASLRNSIKEYRKSRGM